MRALSRMTITPTMIQGGIKSNSVPESISLTCDVLGRRLVLDGEGGQVIEKAGGGVTLRLILFNALDYLGQPVQCIGPLPGRRRVGAGPLDVYFHLQAALLAHT